MLKTRIFLIIISGLLIGGLFLLPKVVVDNDPSVAMGPDSSSTPPAQADAHMQVTADQASAIRKLRAQFVEGSVNQKNAIFADSLANLYQEAGKFDSAAWFSEASSAFFNTTDSWTRTGDHYYQAFTFAVDPGKQAYLAEKAREYYKKVLEKQPDDLKVKNNLAMTYVGGPGMATMQAVGLLREILAEDPKNEQALFNLGMLSFQSTQYEKAVGHLEKLVAIYPNHTQGRLLLGISLINTGDKKGAREQLEKVKQLDDDPAVQATVDTYLKDLK